MLRTLAVLNQKGGVGKTTVTLGLASAAMAVGRRVLIVDLDPQGSAGWVLGIDTASLRHTITDVLASRRTKATLPIVSSEWSPNIDVLPGSPELQNLEMGATQRLKSALEQLQDDYEVILIDCPPSLGNLARNALTAARHALVVVEPSALGLRGIVGVADLIDDVWDTSNPDLELSGVILNRVPTISTEADRRIDELARTVGKRAIWSPAIPQRVILNQAVGERRPIHAYGAKALDPINAFDSLWRKVRGVVQASR